MNNVTKVQKLLIDAFIEEINEKEFKSINVTSITKRAKVNRTSFYLYWSDVMELATYLCSEYYIFNFDEFMDIDIREEEHRKSIYNTYVFIDKNRRGILGLWNIRETNFEPYLLMKDGHYLMMKRKLIQAKRPKNEREYERIELFSRLFAACTMTTMQYFLIEKNQTIEKTVDDIMLSLHHGMLEILKK